MIPLSPKNQRLFTPGPLTTSLAVKQKMLQDLGARDPHVIALTQSIRKRLLQLAEVDDTYTTILTQGNHTFSIESVLSSTIPRHGKILIISNGEQGALIRDMARLLFIPHTFLSYEEDQTPDLKEIETSLRKDSFLTHVIIVHCETTSGIINPIQQVGKLCHQFKKTYIVDACHTFGAIPIHFSKCFIDYLISTSCHCIEGIAGLSFVIAKQKHLEKTEGLSKSLSLDLYAQWKSLEKLGEFKQTPLIQIILAFEQALTELEKEGGIQGRYSRYLENHQLLVKNMTQLGFKTYLKPELMSPLITSFRYPFLPHFNYELFYELLFIQGDVISSGTIPYAQTFKIGNMGQIFSSDILRLTTNIQEILQRMNIEINPLQGLLSQKN